MLSIVNLFGRVIFPSIANREQCAFWYAKFCKPPIQSGGIAILMIYQLYLVSEAHVLTLA